MGNFLAFAASFAYTVFAYFIIKVAGLWGGVLELVVLS
jgi:hypothetical protein